MFVLATFCRTPPVAAQQLVPPFTLPADCFATFQDNFPEAISRPELRLPPELTAMPEQVRGLPPRYPELLRTRGIDGWVLLAFVVETNGDLKHLTVVSVSHQAFRATTLRAAATWRFAPAKIGDDIVPALMCQYVGFTVQRELRHAA